VKASETHVYQVFANLVRNAIKYNDSEGAEIGIYPVHAAGDSENWFHVRDNGSGIPEEDLDNIFTPFFKGETGETGIGLSIVEKILRIYHGDIRVYNDDGACFEFTFRDSFPD
jgi:signal transduction histidine kinase